MESARIQSNKELPMDNQTHTAHSNFKKGLSDYNDGGNVSHHGGNLENRINQPTDEDIFEDQNMKVEFGKVALGNDLVTDSEEDQDTDLNYE